ncbi:MAG: hypothetical protein RJA35_1365 [Actinomycetota bacterium]
MRKVVVLGAMLALIFGVSGCAATDGGGSASPTQSNAPAIDPSLIPTAAPASVIDVAADGFKQASGDYVFKVGDGPTWCTISPSFKMSICEQSEVATLYAPIPVPSTCQYSYGYQVELKDEKPTDGTDQAFFPCLGSTFTDPSGAKVLLDGQRIKVGSVDCFVAGATARCDNKDGSFIVLGPKAWALGQAKA